MPHTLPMVEARQRLTALPDELEQSPETGAIAVTRRGKPVLAIMSWELYETIVETLEIMSDPDMMAAVRQGIREMEAGQGIPWETARKGLRS